MASDQEIAKEVETVLSQSDPNAVTSLNDVVQQLESKLGLDLSHKAGFIRDQITFLLRSNPVPEYLPQQTHTNQYQNTLVPQQFVHPQFTLQQQQQLQLQQQGFYQHENYPQPQPQPAVQTPVQHRPPPVVVVVPEKARAGVKGNASVTPKGSTLSVTKRRGGPGGLNKVCSVSPELQAIVGQPALPRTEIVKQLWVYIRKHSLQDPGNKRRIICDDALRIVFETDCTDMFKMNKLLAKHITPLEPTKSSQAKKLKVDEDEPANQDSISVPCPVMISDELAKFFETGEREMLQSEALGRVWEYVKVNNLEDPLNSMVILCDPKLKELLGCESISALGIQETLARHHLFNRL